MHTAAAAAVMQSQSIYPVAFYAGTKQISIHTFQTPTQTAIFIEKEELKVGLIESQIQMNFPRPN